MNDVLKFSVLMSIYKGEKASNLEEALASTLNQSVKPSEIVLVEDGPLTEELYNVIEEYAQKYSNIKIVKLDNNVGLGKALNEGLKYCSYEYVARMDSDDICLSNRFEIQMKIMNGTSHYDVIGGEILEFDDCSGKDLSIRHVPSDMKDIRKYVKKRNPINHVTVMFKKKSVVDAGGYMDCPYFEDYYLWVRMLKKGYVFYNTTDVLVRVRAGLSMIKRRGNWFYIKSIINFETKLLKLNEINFAEFLLNIFIRSMVSVLPSKIRYYFYQKRLRNEEN